MTKRILLYIAASLFAISASAQPIDKNQPRLVVNIVVSGMRAVDMERYQNNLGLGGLRLLYEEGMRYDNCLYSYKQTTTPVSLATLATGALPSTHGVVGLSWFDYVTNEAVDLYLDPTATNLEYPTAEGGYSAVNLFVPTLSEALLVDSPQSQAVTVAFDPASAITLNGKQGLPFWFDAATCNWASSNAFMEQLPEWVVAHNHTEADIAKTAEKWTMSLHSDLYTNTRYLDRSGAYILSNAVKVGRNEDRKARFAKYYNFLRSTPAGNDIVTSFAKLAVASLKLGGDDHVDILNVCFDASRNVVESFGPESIEAEDMYYKIDRNISNLMKFINSQVKDAKVVYLLTSDHGTSSTTLGAMNHFNVRQFEVILNGFLSVRYGNDSWVLACRNGAIYLNHNAIFKQGLNLAEVQAEAATFAMQMQGVSHAVTSSTLMSSYFGNGYAQKIQSGFYARRSGDVILNFMPNWIEQNSKIISQSGSLYNYDRSVPLIIYGQGIPTKVISRKVDPISIAPTLATIMNINEPAAAEGQALEEFTK